MPAERPGCVRRRVRRWRSKSAPIDDERPAQRRCGICCGQPEYICVVVHPLAMANGECARGRRALGDDHYETWGRHREQRQALAPAHIWEPERRRPAGHRTNHRDTPCGEVKGRACPNRGQNGDERKRQMGYDAITCQDGSRDRKRETQCWNIRPRQRFYDLPGLDHRMSRSHAHTEHVPQHCHSDLDPHTGEKPDQDGTR